MEYTSTRNRQKPPFNHFWSYGYVIIWSKIPIQGLSPIMNSGTKAWAFQYQSQRDDFAESLFSRLPILKWLRWNRGWLGWIISNGYMQLSSTRCSFHDVDLRTSNPGPTRQTGPVHPPSVRCAFIHPACRWMRSCWWPDHARQLGRGHATSLSALTWLGKTRLLGSARPTGQNYFPSCCFLLIINSTGPIGNLSFRVTPSAFR